ncbi:MAG TPA: HD domain-containing phosphohydrolase [Candidatus Sumerlaeota bacterium]|nr:HD domain-containing phosphohydrolase [Candidatus Sumerlaeota bacterium]
MQTGDQGKRRSERLTEIGIALSAELNLNSLLEKIVRYARELTSADGGTLYLLREDRLHFTIIQNESLGVNLGGASGGEINLEPVTLDKTNVSACAAILGRTVVIDDVYECADFDFSGPRRYDAVTGYHSHSMLVVPMKDHEGQITGVLQLINAADPASGAVTAFPRDVVPLVEALASQAAVAINNASLVEETRAIFNGLIRVLAVSLDARSRSMGNHIQRVALMNEFLAQRINEISDGPLAGVRFTEKELDEIRIAGWLHDVGKVTTPGHIMEKHSKLEGIFDRIGLIRMRFQYIREQRRLRAVESVMEIRRRGGDPGEESAVMQSLTEELRDLNADWEFIVRCNRPCENMSGEDLARLKEISKKTYIEDGRERPLLSRNEVHHLTIRHGNLTAEEITVMRGHILWTNRMLREIPFRGHLKNVPLYAGQHHEKLDGSGYPDGLTAKDIPLPSRILAVADIYEALTAKDRSYKKELSEDEMLGILNSAAARGELDRDITDLLIRRRLHREFEQEYKKNERGTHGNEDGQKHT